VLDKPLVNCSGKDGQFLPQQAKSENYIEKTTLANGTLKIDSYINDPHGTFVPLFHILLACKEHDTVNIYLNSGIYSDDASLILGSMDLCKAIITVHVGFVVGFYGTCIVASADKTQYTEMSAISLNTPKEFLTLRGMTNLEQQITYIKNSTQQYIDILVDRGFCTTDEMNEIISKNKSMLFKRDDLARRLSNCSSDNSL